MAYLLDIEMQDANGDKSDVSMWIGDNGDALTVIGYVKAASNAKVLSAHLSTPVPLTTITDNDPVAANVETARTKALISMRGADTGSSGRPFAEVTVGIPAPIGSLINGRSGDTSNAEVQSLKTKVLSKSGVQMTTVRDIRYSR